MINSLEVAYSFDNGITVTGGGNNFLDETPDDNKGAAAGVGNKYSQFAPLGFNGAFWYGRVAYNF